MIILQDQKLFESLALKKQKEKLQTPFCCCCCSGEVLPSVYTLISAGVRRAYTSKGRFCLSAVQTPIIS